MLRAPRRAGSRRLLSLRCRAGCAREREIVGLDLARGGIGRGDIRQPRICVASALPGRPLDAGRPGVSSHTGDAGHARAGRPRWATNPRWTGRAYRSRGAEARWAGWTCAADTDATLWPRESGRTSGPGCAGDADRTSAARGSGSSGAAGWPGCSGHACAGWAG